MSDHDFGDRIARTVMTAQKAAQRSVSVSVHVGQDVWDDLLEMVSKVSNLPLGERGSVGYLWGFPIVMERDWPPNEIQVHTTEMIP